MTERYSNGRRSYDDWEQPRSSKTVYRPNSNRTGTRRPTAGAGQSVNRSPQAAPSRLQSSGRKVQGSSSASVSGSGNRPQNAPRRTQNSYNSQPSVYQRSRSSSSRPSSSSDRRTQSASGRPQNTSYGSAPSVYQRSEYSGHRSQGPGSSSRSGQSAKSRNPRSRQAYDPYPSSNDSRRKKKKKSKALLIILPILIVLLIIGVLLAIPIVSTKNQANALKEDLKLVLESAKAKDADAAEAALKKSYEDKEKLSETLNNSFWSTASNISRVDNELSVGRDLIGILTEAQDNLLTPLVDLMKVQPLTELKVGEGGFNVTLINSYLDFAEEVMPEVRTLADKVMSIDSDSMVGGTIAEYKDVLSTALNSYDEASALLPLLRTILGNGEDRLYLFAAQNSAEIRASGGFPGSIGTIRIEDGVLTIGDFNSVYNVLAPFVSADSNISQVELSLFGSWVNAPRDSCFMPAFDRTAEVWAVAYEDYQREDGAIDRYNEDGTIDRTHYKSDKKDKEKEKQDEEENQNGYYYYDENWEPTYVEYVDGVVSLTPAIIQMLLADVGEITLSDGTVLNGENATKVLQHDLYHKYYDKATYSSDSWDISDALFAETAKIAMSEFVSSFEISKFADYYKLFTEAAEKNIMMIWMRDEAEEEVIAESGASGKLNYDPYHPVHGIYFSLADPSKMGWYLDIEPEVSEPVYNDDGSQTYNVKLTLRNTITEFGEDGVAASDEYIIGSYEGGIRGFVHIFAPYGGYITDMETENWSTYIFEGSYMDLEVNYNLDILIQPGEEEVFYYKITTAEDVDEPMRIVTTPTLTEYR